MQPARPAPRPKNSLLVTFSTLDGQTLSGRMAAFDPRAPDHRLETFARGPEEPAALRVLPVERVAWVGMHRDPEAPQRAPEDARLWRVRFLKGGALKVLATRAELERAVGFFAYPSEPDSMFDQLFVFHHAVHSRELDAPLGELLVRDGAITPEELVQGLEAQQAARATPLGAILVEQERLTAEEAQAALALQRRRKQRIGEVIVEAGLATVEDVERALDEQKRRRGLRLGEVLVQLGVITEADLALTLAEKFHLRFVDLEQLAVDPVAVRSVPREVLERYGVLPVALDAQGLTVALSDPLFTEAVDTLRVVTRRPVREVLATASQLKRFLAATLETLDRPADEFEKTLAQVAAESDKAAVAEAREVGAHEAADSAVIRLVNQIIAEAYKRGVSDIHIEPNGGEGPVRVRFRVDGDCATFQELPASARSAVLARLKIMANLDISERRKPQDGKIRYKFHDKMIELRVATIPTVNGNEDAVLRILAASKPLPVEKLGLNARNFEQVRRLMKQPYGLILCVGPTGSGKTTTLHAILGGINTEDMKIWTAEDPVEITQPGLRQVQVQPKIGFTFAAAMRSFLRADPDAIMVGEMRDHETAETAVEASLTGHLVFSTLHTNSAPETVTRLMDMGLEPFTFADALLGVLAQRLARALCRCAATFEAAEGDLTDLRAALGEGHPRARELVPGLPLRRAVGYDACGRSGYKGRLGLHELLVQDDTLRKAIQQRAPVHELRLVSMAGGMTTLLQDGAEKVLDGKTDLRQVVAVCSR